MSMPSMGGITPTTVGLLRAPSMELELEADEELGPDDDEPEDEPVDDKQVPNLVLAQFENVKRVKNKWKVILKDGICNLEGRDYMFHKGAGEFEW